MKTSMRGAVGRMGGMHGGPLREPLCYAQIGGLTVATGITLVLVPLIYTVFVHDLRLIKWESAAPARPEPVAARSD